VTPEQFRDLAIAAIERQIAAGIGLIRRDWGTILNDDASLPVLSCGCAVTLTVQDTDPAAARSLVLTEGDSSVVAAGALGLTPGQVDLFIIGFEAFGQEAFGSADDDPCLHANAWRKAGAVVAKRFAAQLSEP